MNFQDKQILQKILAQDAAIGSVFNLFIRQVAPLLERYNYGSKELWVKNGLVEQRIDREVERLNDNLKSVIVGNQKWAWNLANAKNDSLVEGFIKGMALPSSQKEGLFAQNLRALEQFVNRKNNGFSVSENIWRTSRQAKTQLEYYLESGIGTGRSAATLSRDIRQLLEDPDTLFRRVRDKNGNLVPSKPMKGYNPGQGRYRSAYKNALRLSATEINMAYRSSDHERWQGLDFVVGIEVKLSSAHPRTDICDHMKGRYPKDFKFTGWHPFCLCFAVPILMPQEDFMNYIEGDDDTRMAIIQRNRVQSIPYSANQYLDKHQQSIDGWKKPPIWVKSNFNEGKIGNGLRFLTTPSKPEVLPTVNEAIIKAEREIWELKDHERIIIIDDDGRVVARKDGGENYVEVGDLLHTMKNRTYTHNHPYGWKFPKGNVRHMGNSFSINDVLIAVRGDAKELRTVTPVNTFIMRRPDNGWPSIDRLIFEYKSTETEVFHYLYSWLALGYDSRVAKAEILHLHLTWKRVAKQLGISYTKKSSI